jgi:hypothetical protein
MLAREPESAKRCLPRLLDLPEFCPRQPLPPARLELGLRGLKRRRVRLSMELRASEDRTHQLRSEIELLREQAVSAERWLLTNQKEIEEKLIARMSSCDAEGG